MRKILMSKPGEFVTVKRTDFVRGVAVKMLADVINKAKKPEKADSEVSVSNDPTQSWATKEKL